MQTFREVLEGGARCDVLPESLDVEALLVVDGAKGVGHCHHLSSLLLEDLRCPGAHIPKALQCCLSHCTGHSHLEHALLTILPPVILMCTIELVQRLSAEESWTAQSC